MRRFKIRPYGSTIRPTRLLSMLMAIAVLVMVFQRARDPMTWRILLDAKENTPEQASSVPKANEPRPETIIDGPNDKDDAELADVREMLELVTDKAALKPREMHAYWRLMAWSHSMPFAKLDERARRDVPFTQFWEQPQKYRAHPVSLRLHVRRILEYDAPQNPLHFAKTYEAWGWTDESRSYPYVVVFSECPEGLTIGTDVRAEVEFTGYFLKVMTYSAFDTARGAPLLIGRVRMDQRAIVAKQDPAESTSLLVAGIAGLGLIGLITYWQHTSRRTVCRIPVNEIALTPDPIFCDDTTNEDRETLSPGLPPILVEN